MKKKLFLTIAITLIFSTGISARFAEAQETSSVTCTGPGTGNLYSCESTEVLSPSPSNCNNIPVIGAQQSTSYQCNGLPAGAANCTSNTNIFGGEISKTCSLTQQPPAATQKTQGTSTENSPKIQTTPTPQAQQAPSSAKTIGYTPLEPLPGLENVSNLDFPTFLGAIFKLLITAGALLAVGTLVYAGIMYIVSGAGAELANAKMRMRAALLGMVILLGAWLMLNTINPTLLNFNLSSIGAGNTAPVNTSQGVTTQTTSSTNDANSAIYGVENIPNASQLQSGIVDCGGKVPVLSSNNEVVCQ